MNPKRLLFLCCLLIFSLPVLAQKNKNIILVIGDGMGFQQLSLLYSFAKFSSSQRLSPEQLVFPQIAKHGSFAMSMVNPENYIVTDSACSATQLATGKTSLPGAIGVDAKGYAVKTILEIAQAKGKSVGLVSDTRLTHATPAAFAAHAAYRSEEESIAKQIIEHDVDLLLSAGMGYFISKKHEDRYQQQTPYSFKARRSDSLDLIAKAKEQSYQVVFDRQTLDKAGDGKLLGLFGDKQMPHGIWYSQNKDNPKRSIPSLKEMAELAVKRLSKNEKGFFLMLEAGQIDWAAHANDAGTMLHQLLEANEAMASLYKFAQENDDTLLLITADHETGSFGLGYSLARPFESLGALPGPYYKNSGYQGKVDYLGAEVMDRLYAQKGSFHDILDAFDKSKTKEAAWFKMQKLVLEYTGLSIDAEQAQRILATAPHPYAKDQPKFQNFPAIQGQAAFYNHDKDTRSAMIARELGPLLGVTWATGGHTASPVPVFAYSGNKSHEKFRAVLHHADIGRMLIELLD